MSASPRCDVVVVGLGAHGSAIAAHCAAAGLRVLGVDRGDPPHRQGGHHGESRIIRKAYFEHPGYVPLLERAYRLWDALEAGAREPLQRRTGGLMIGRPESELVAGTLASARLHGLPVERLSAAALARRHPQFRLDPAMEAVLEPQAGILFPEACVRAHLAHARSAGATLRTGCAARIGARSASGVEVELATADGTRETVRAARCVVAAGAGLAGLGLPLSARTVVERQVVAHFVPTPAADPARWQAMPLFAVEEDDGAFYYGFPDLGTGVKVGEHHRGATGGEADVDPDVHPADLDNLRGFLRRRLPDADGDLASAVVCRYANTPDGHFALDAREPSLTVVSACSGHGFKFAPVIGEIIALKLSGRPVPVDLAWLGAGRFEPGAGISPSDRASSDEAAGAESRAPRR